VSSRNGRLAARPPSDPWRRAPVSELQDQVLPRWFVLTAVIMVPVAVVALVAAFAVFGPDDVPVAARRPPPAEGFTNGVGDLRVGTTAPVPLEPPCPALDGLRIGGTEADRAVLAAGLQRLCDLPPEQATLVEDFAAADGTVRFAQFADTGVDSTASRTEPLILLNNRFAVADEPAWIAPLVVHDLTVLGGEPGTAATALAARQAEAEACRTLLDDPTASRACRDASALLASQDPLHALRAVGYR
jgi:hypothetical protein